MGKDCSSRQSTVSIGNLKLLVLISCIMLCFLHSPVNAFTITPISGVTNGSTMTNANPVTQNLDGQNKNNSKMNLCKFSIDPVKAEEVHRQFQRYIQARRPGVFYLNFVYQHHESENVTLPRQLESGVFIWSIVTGRWLYLLTYPVDLHVVTFGTILGDSKNIYVPITVNNSDECFMYYSYAVNDVKHIIKEHIIRNLTRDVRVCHRQFQNQEVKLLWYQFTRIWDGYIYECSNASCTSKNCDYIVEMSSITNVVYILCCLCFLFYPLIFSVVKRDKMTDPKWMHRYHRNKDIPFGFHRLKMRYFFSSPIKGVDVVSKTYIPECRLILLLLIALITAYIARPCLDYRYFGKKLRLYPDLFIPNDAFRKLFVQFMKCINVEPFSSSEITLVGITAFVLSIVLYLFHVISLKVCCEQDDFVIVIDPANPFWKKENAWLIPVSDFSLEGYTKTGGIAEMFYKRMTLGFTTTFWQFVISKSFGDGKDVTQCCPLKFLRPILRLLCIFWFFLVMILNLAFNLITCFIPIFWLLFGTPIKIYYYRNKYDNNRKVSEIVTYIIIYLVCFIVGFVFLVDLIIRSVSFLIKIITYFLFVAIPSFPTAQLRVVLIVVSSLTYLGKYVNGFLSAYEKLLSLVFEAEDNLLKENNDEKADDAKEKQTTDSVEFIPIEEFDYISTNTFSVGLQIMSLLIKICVTGMFLFTAVTALQNTGNFTATRRTNFVEFLSLVFIVLSPTVAEIALSVSLEDQMDMQKTEIAAMVRKWNELKNKSINKKLFVVNSKTGTGKQHIAETRKNRFEQVDTIIRCCGCCTSKNSKRNICMTLGYYILFVFCFCFGCDKDGRCVCWRYMKDSKKTGEKYITKRGSIYGRKVKAIVFEYPCFNLKDSNQVLHPWEEKEDKETLEEEEIVTEI